MISDCSGTTSEYNTTQGMKFIWTDRRDTNVRDYSVPGMVVFRGFTWMFQQCLTKPLFALLEKVFLCKGLQRHLYSHMGSLYFVERRQSCQISEYISQYIKCFNVSESLNSRFCLFSIGLWSIMFQWISKITIQISNAENYKCVSAI